MSASDAPLPEIPGILSATTIAAWPTEQYAVHPDSLLARRFRAVCASHEALRRRVVWSAEAEPLIEAIEAALANCEAAHEAEFVRRVNAEGALHRYGGHDETCLLGQFVATYSSEPQPEPAPCTCGFEAALARVRNPEPEYVRTPEQHEQWINLVHGPETCPTCGSDDHAVRGKADLGARAIGESWWECINAWHDRRGPEKRMSE